MKGSRYIRLLLALLTSALGYLALSAQTHYSIQHSLSYKDGLYGAYPQQSLLAQNGSLWIYTDAALNRYNGDRFQPIPLPPKQDPAQINGILAEDGAGQIWAGRFVYKTIAGAQRSYSQTEIFLYSPQTGQVVDFDSLLAPKLGHTAAEIRHLYAREHIIYLLLSNGEVHAYSSEEGFRQILNGQFGQSNRSIVVPGPGRSLWVQSKTALLRLGPDGHTLDSIPVPCPAIALQPLPGGQLAVQFPYSITYMGENVHQLIAKAGGGLSHALQLGSGAVIPVHQGIKLGISPNGGLHLITPDDWLVYTAKGEQAFSWKTFFPGQQHDILPTAHKGEIFFDGYGVAYANFHSRVNVLLVQPSPFTIYKTTLGKSMRAFLELPDGELIASSYTGNMATQGISPSPFPDSLDAPFLSTCRGKDGEIWVGGHYEKILVFDQKLRLLRQYDMPATSQGLIACLSLFKSSNGTIWAGAHNGLHYYDPQCGELRPCTAINEAFQLHNEQVRHISEFQGALWIGTTKGLYAATIDGQPKTGSQAAVHATVNHSFWSSPDSCWVSTKEEGLLLWLPQQSKTTAYTREKTGLPDNTIYAVYEDQQGRLWLPTNLGLGWLSTTNMEKGSFSKVSGLPADEFNFASSYKAQDGQLFLGGVNGACSFQPGEYPFLPTSSEVKLSVAFLGRPDARGEITDATADFVSSGEIELSNGTSTAAHITFSMASYLPKASYQYDYRLEGLSEDWQPIAGPKVVLSGLPYGSYTLQVRGRLNETWFESSHLAIPVRVRKPFYLMIWFWIAVPLALTGLGYGFSRLRIKHMSKQRQMLRQ